MKKSALLMLTAGLVLCAQAAVASLSDCTDEAAISRYDAEGQCYSSYGPKSGQWTTVDTSPLDNCLHGVRSEFSAAVEICGEVYGVEERAPIDKPAMTSAGIAVGILLLLLI